MGCISGFYIITFLCLHCMCYVALVDYFQHSKIFHNFFFVLFFPAFLRTLLTIFLAFKWMYSYTNTCLLAVIKIIWITCLLHVIWIILRFKMNIVFSEHFSFPLFWNKLVYLTCFNVIWYVYLITAIGLTPGGSSTVHIYTQTVHRTTQCNATPRTEHT
jgi:hypothetical protein